MAREVQRLQRPVYTNIKHREKLCDTKFANWVLFSMGAARRAKANKRK